MYFVQNNIKLLLEPSMGLRDMSARARGKEETEDLQNLGRFGKGN